MLFSFWQLITQDPQPKQVFRSITIPHEWFLYLCPFQSDKSVASTSPSEVWIFGTKRPAIGSFWIPTEGPEARAWFAIANAAFGVCRERWFLVVPALGGLLVLLYRWCERGFGGFEITNLPPPLKSGWG